MDSRSAYLDGVKNMFENILGPLEADNVSRVILVGEAGIGKTWLARNVYEYATQSRPFYIALWLNLNKDFDEISLYEDIASQLSLVPENEGSEEDDSDMENSEDDEEQKNQYLMKLKDQIQQKLKKKMLKGVGKKYSLLVLDDEGSVTREEKVMKDLYLGDFLVQGKDRPLKVLLTRRKGNEGTTHSDEEIHSHIMFESHFFDQSQPIYSNSTRVITDDYLAGLLEGLLKGKGESLALLGSLEKYWGRNQIVRMSMRLPAAVVVLAKSLNRICQHSLLVAPERLEEVRYRILASFKSDTSIGCEGTTTCRSTENPVLRLTYELLYTKTTTTITDCFWHSLSFFEHCGCVYYKELIAHWILEGYFDPVRSVTQAYDDGHAILMEFLNRGVLKTQEDNMVMPEVAMKNVIDTRRHGLGRSRLRLSRVYGGNKKGGLGKINKIDDMIEGVRATRNKEKFTTIIVSGNHLRREAPEKFFGKLKDIEVLGLLEPTLTSFVPALLKLVKLRVLVIRNCDLLKDIEELKALQGILVLEVSGASSLKEISNEFFTAMPDLQSLHLSGLQIKSSPSSICKLKRLHFLIIRDCPVLEDLPDISELVNLEVVDISGARGLQTCFDKERKNKRKNRNFCHLQQLQLLDISESQIERLPMFQDSAVAGKLHSLTRLLLRNCKKLIKLPNLKPLTGLQILDLSGTSGLVKIMEVCFEDKKELRVLNLSGSNLRQLPSTIRNLSNLEELLLRDCTNLKVLPNIQELTNLGVIDVCGCTELNKIEGSFEDMFYLREVNLLGTEVKITPGLLPNQTKICCLKKIIRADGRSIQGENWNDLKEAMQSVMSESSGPSDAVVKSPEISELESRLLGELQANEPLSSDVLRKRGTSREYFCQFLVYRALYQKSMPFFYPESHPKFLEIHGSNGLNDLDDLEKEALPDAEYITFVDVSCTCLTSIFDKKISVKGCFLRMCDGIKDLFSGVTAERLGSLETLSITNLPLLETITCGRTFTNLKNLSIDCCPNIRTLFLEPSQLPSSLEVLHIKFCRKLERVFEEEGEMSALTTLCLYELPALSNIGGRLPNLVTFKVRNCPKLYDLEKKLKGADSIMPDISEASSPED